MVVKILLGVVVVVAVVLLFAATKPSKFHIEKSVSIQAPPEKVYALIADFHNWPQWAPQDREDPTMQRTYSGATTGQGAVSDWKRPFKVQNAHGFTLTPAGGGTQLSWSAEGTNLYVMKVMELFVGVNGLMGKHFEAGLGNLKRIAEQ